jgi:ATP-dependent Clp protease ATP-binding subunit ClpA
MNPFKALDDMRTIKQLLTESERIARDLGEREPGAEHLLLSAMALPDGSGARAMATVGADADAVRSALVAEQADALVSAGMPRERAEALAVPEPLDDGDRPRIYAAGPTAREVFRAAGDRARASKQRLAGAHVVAAIADVEHGTVARVLDRLGVDRQQLSEAARAELTAS